MKKIAFFSPLHDNTHKYEIIIELSKKLSEQGNVLIVDGNPESSLTSHLCAYNQSLQEIFYAGKSDIHSSLRPFLSDAGAVTTSSLASFIPGVYCIMGSVKLCEIDVTTSRISTSYLNLMSSFNSLIENCANIIGVEWVLIDLPSNFSTIAQSLLMISDLYIPFFKGDIFGLQTVDTFLNIVSKWNKSYELLNSRNEIISDCKHKLFKSFVYPESAGYITKVSERLNKNSVIDKLGSDYVCDNFLAVAQPYPNNICTTPQAYPFLVKDIFEESGIPS